MSGRRFVLATLAMLAGGLVLIATFVVIVDPYWLWRDHVRWHLNLALETRMRFVKALQVVMRQPEVVLLGSSVVYRGLDPSAIAGKRVYNLGISSLRIREAEAFVQYLLRWTRPTEIVFAVDYFAFDRHRLSEPGFDPTLPAAGYLAQATATAFLSGTAVSDAWRISHKLTADPDGRWQRDGYKATRPRNADEIRDILKMTRALFSTIEVSGDEMAALESIVALTRNAGIQLKLFVPPYHESWLDTVRKSVKSGLSFEAWLVELSALCRRHKVELWDFATANPYSRSSVGADGIYYLDPSHFSPTLGGWIYSRLGLLPETQAPPNFGRRVC